MLLLTQQRRRGSERGLNGDCGGRVVEGVEESDRQGEQTKKTAAQYGGESDAVLVSVRLTRRAAQTYGDRAPRLVEWACAY